MAEWQTCLPAGRRAELKMAITVYALKSTSRKYIYVGMTDNLERRISQHSDGKERTTRAYRPFELIYTKVYETRTQARVREKYLKSGVGKEFLRTNNFLA